MRLARIPPPVLLGLVLLCCRRGETPGDPALVSATQFVRTFYGWYVPSAQHGTGMEVAVRDSAALFAPELVRALQADAEAQAADSEEVVGLDGDPFLDAQDFCDTYTAGTARRAGLDVLVDIRGNCSARGESRPDVVAELSQTQSGWVFRNFRYPRRDSDLMKDLEDLRRARDSARGANP